MDLKLLNVSKENYIPRSRIIAIIFPDSNKIRNLVSAKREENQLIDATRGRKNRSIIVLDNGTIILSNINPDTLAKNYEME